MGRNQILTTLAKHRRTMTDRFAVRELYLFGSAARDQATDTSDVDLLVEFSRPVGLLQFISLQRYLEELLDARVDLGTRKSLKPEISAQVLQEAVRVS
jgi:predicted nucleotidyltransferase